MNIAIRSRFKFNETVHDNAYGLAKKLILGSKTYDIKRVKGFVLTAKKTENSVFVKVQREF